MKKIGVEFKDCLLHRKAQRILEEYIKATGYTQSQAIIHLLLLSQHNMETFFEQVLEQDMMGKEKADSSCMDKEVGADNNDNIFKYDQLGDQLENIFADDRKGDNL